MHHAIFTTFLFGFHPKHIDFCTLPVTIDHLLQKGVKWRRTGAMDNKNYQFRLIGAKLQTYALQLYRTDIGWLVDELIF